MRILYATQATGNGHLVRARSLVPEFQKHAVVDVLTSGYQGSVDLPFEVKYKCKGYSYIIGNKGKIDYFQTFRKLDIITYLRDVWNLNIKDYDLVINDFEPVSSWAAKKAKVPCIAMSHQSSFLSKNTPRPSYKHQVAELIFKYFAPSDDYIGFHFDRFDQKIQTPIIRKEILEITPTNKGHITVYLPGYREDLLHEYFSIAANYQFQIFSPKVRSIIQKDNSTFYPVDGNRWIDSFASCHAAIMGAGFEGPSEAIYLGKQLAVIPLKGQYEQVCNATALLQMGVKVMDDLDLSFIHNIDDWAHSTPLQISYPDHAADIVKNIVELQETKKPILAY